MVDWKLKAELVFTFYAFCVFSIFISATINNLQNEKTLVNFTRFKNIIFTC